MARRILSVALMSLVPLGGLGAADGEAYFPEVEGRNLQFEDRVFPQDFVGEWNLALVAFQREHQELINTWLPEAEELEGRFPGFAYYEFPIIRELGGLSQRFIDGGMRVAVRQAKARERTVTFYTDKERFRTALQIPGEETIHVILVDPAGEVLWRTTGPLTAEKLTALEERLAALAE